MSNSLLLITTLSWILTAVALAWLYRKQATWLNVILTLIFCGLGAATATSAFWRWQMGVEREAARHLVGVAILDFEERLAFLRKNLSDALEQAKSVESDPATTIDWSGTFEFQHRDIQRQFDIIIQNAFIQRYYSVWVERASMHQQNLNVLAAALAKLKEPRPKRMTFDNYVQQVEDVKKFFSRLESLLTSGTYVEPIL